MAWDPEKNKVLKSKKVVVGEDTLIIEMFSYDKGPKKIGFRQEIETKKDGKKVVAMHNFTPEQGLKLAISLKKMCKEELGLE
jgi:hypothetical protein